MKRILLAVTALALTAIFSSPAAAQVPGSWGGPQGMQHAAVNGPMANPYAVPVNFAQPGMNPEAAYQARVERCRYGWHPVLQRLFFVKRTNCNSCNDRASGCGTCKPCGLHGLKSCKLCLARRAPAVQGYPAPMTPAGGTLVFPNHPFVRSPRDFFMLDQ